MRTHEPGCRAPHQASFHESRPVGFHVSRLRVPLARQGRHAPCALASWRPATPDRLRCAVLAPAPGNSARATGDSHHERQIACFARTSHLPGLRRCLRYGQHSARQAHAREPGALHHDGLGLCAGYQQLCNDGFVALVECDPERNGAPAAADRVKPEQAYRTGYVAHLKREAPRGGHVMRSVDNKNDSH